MNIWQKYLEWPVHAGCSMPSWKPVDRVEYLVTRDKQANLDIWPGRCRSIAVETLRSFVE
jgi:hypothetical protein